jgi:hypothetical protein
MKDGTFANPERAGRDIVPFVSPARTAAGGQGANMIKINYSEILSAFMKQRT